MLFFSHSQLDFTIAFYVNYNAMLFANWLTTTLPMYDWTAELAGTGDRSEYVEKSD